MINICEKFDSSFNPDTPHINLNQLFFLSGAANEWKDLKSTMPFYASH